MKKYSLFLACLSLMTFLSSQSLASEIIIVNGCDFPLKGLRIHKVGSDTAFSLLESPLAAQEAIKVQIQEKESTWNVLTEDPAGSTVTFENIDFDNIKQMHIKDDGTVEIFR